MSKEYKKKNLNRGLIVQSLIDFGVEGAAYDLINSGSGQYHLKGQYDGRNVLFNVFESKDGTTTLGFASGQDRELFELLADEIIRRCTFSNESRLELSLPKFPEEHFKNLIEFLISEGASEEERKSLPYDGLQLRLKGCQGDSLTIKTYKNKTIQFQGKHAQLASLVWDFLCNVLSLEDVITKQSKTYEISVTVNEIKDELGAKMPVSHQFLEDTVRKQLTSALMMSKVGLPLEDFSVVAFPALRGLEGFIKQVLIKAGLNIADMKSFGEYFEKPTTKFELRKEYSVIVAMPYSEILPNCYTFLHNQRHGLFHMDNTVETSRILGTIEDARRVVLDVFQMIESASKQISS